MRNYTYTSIYERGKFFGLVMSTKITRETRGKKRQDKRRKVGIFIEETKNTIYIKLCTLKLIKELDEYPKIT